MSRLYVSLKPDRRVSSTENLTSPAGSLERVFAYIVLIVASAVICGMNNFQEFGDNLIERTHTGSLASCEISLP